jgi:hypothetical protein
MVEPRKKNNSKPTQVYRAVTQTAPKVVPVAPVTVIPVAPVTVIPIAPVVDIKPVSKPKRTFETIELINVDDDEATNNAESVLSEFESI